MLAQDRGTSRRRSTMRCNRVFAVEPCWVPMSPGGMDTWDTDTTGAGVDCEHPATAAAASTTATPTTIRRLVLFGKGLTLIKSAVRRAT
jgi:hypothetical protein